jgi:hypothetical protein
MKLADLIRLAENDKTIHYKIDIEWEHINDRALAPTLKGFIKQSYNAGNDWLPCADFTLHPDGAISDFKLSAAYHPYPKILAAIKRFQ